METIRSMLIPGLILVGWFAFATATLVQLGAMGGALEAADVAHREREAAIAVQHSTHADMRAANNDLPSPGRVWTRQ
jgi:hypothetical protein